MIAKEINGDFEKIYELVSRPVFSDHCVAARMLRPLIIKLTRYLDAEGADRFFQIVRQNWLRFAPEEMKDIVISVMSEVINEPLALGRIELERPHVGFFADISLEPSKRVLKHIITRAGQSHTGRVIVYQNMRMGGMYPPMEEEMKAVLASQGYPVYEIDFDGTADGISETDGFKTARIILARFKVSSAPEPSDTVHPADFITAQSQKNKFMALYKLAIDGTPVVMVDASKNKKSLAQIYIKLPWIESFNALDLMSMPFHYHHLYWIGAYAFDNVGAMLPSSGGAFKEGPLYGYYARLVAGALANDGAFWSEIVSEDKCHANIQ